MTEWERRMIAVRSGGKQFNVLLVDGSGGDMM
jgi:hypothetical protein